MSNPLLNDRFAENVGIIEGEVMTINGTINKTLLMLFMLVISASYTWMLTLQGFVDKAQMLGYAGAFVALVSIIAMYFTKKASGIWAVIYSVAEGFFLGYLSVFFESLYAGIVPQAIAGTFAAMFSMLALYRTGVIKCTDKFRAIIFTAMMSVFLIYLIQIVASFFGRSIPQIFTASPIGIGFSAVVVLIASFGFIMDFDFIEKASQRMAPKYFEWMGAIGLMTSIVWLYVEILNLLLKINSRN